MKTLSSIFQKASAATLLCFTVMACQPEIPSLSHIKAGQTYGMEVHEVNQFIDGSGTFQLTISDENHAHIYFDLSPGGPRGYPGKSLAVTSRNSKLQFREDYVTYELGLDSNLAVTQVPDGWAGTLTLTWKCNPTIPHEEISKGFIHFEEGEVCELQENWIQLYEKVLFATSGSYPPATRQYGDTILQVYGPNSRPSCEKSFTIASEKYFLFKLKVGSENHLGWLKVMVTNDWSFPLDGLIYIDSWAVSKLPIEN